MFPRFSTSPTRASSAARACWLARPTAVSDPRRLLGRRDGRLPGPRRDRDRRGGGARRPSAIAYIYNHHFTNDARRSDLADRLIEVAAPEMARVRLVSGGSEANETALRLARTYHVDRGDAERWRIISPAQAYHGSTMGTLALSGRRDALQDPYAEYLPAHLHIPPSTWRFDPTGEAALRRARPGARRRPARTPSRRSSASRSARRRCRATRRRTASGRDWPSGAREHGFLVCFDEIVTGMGRVGSWLAAHQLPIEPDIVTIGKGLGAGYAPLAAVLCREHVYDALAAGLARVRPRAHVGRRAAAVRGRPGRARPASSSTRLVERVRERGPRAARRARSARCRAPRSSARCAAAASCSGSSWSTRATARRSCPTSSTPPRSSTRQRLRARAARHLDALDARRLRGRPDAAGAGVHEHRRRARRDGRAVRGARSTRSRRRSRQTLRERRSASRAGDARSGRAHEQSDAGRWRVRPARDPRRQRLDPRQGDAAGRVRVGAAPRDGDDRPAAGARSRRHADHATTSGSGSARAPATSSCTRTRARCTS